MPVVVEYGLVAVDNSYNLHLFMLQVELLHPLENEKIVLISNVIA